MNGVLLIDKPKEFTSFDVIAVVRKITGQRKTGHTGTLDPNATGVLPVLLGSATKAQDIIPNHDKEYAASFKFGLTTDTLDIWGEVKSQNESAVTKKELEKVLQKFSGEISQVPPMYSAVKKDGQRLYDLARQGVEVEREARKVTVHELELLDFNTDKQEGRLRVFCSKGTYIRTLIDDIGKALGTGAVMTGLRRTSACGFKIDECVTLENLKSLAENGKTETLLRSVESLFEAYDAIEISDAQAKRFSNGGALDLTRTALRSRKNTDGEIFRVKSREGGFLGLGTVKGELLKIYKLFPGV